MVTWPARRQRDVYPSRLAVTNHAVFSLLPAWLGAARAPWPVLLQNVPRWPPGSFLFLDLRIPGPGFLKAPLHTREIGGQAGGVSKRLRLRAEPSQAPPAGNEGSGSSRGGPRPPGSLTIVRAAAPDPERQPRPDRPDGHRHGCHLKKRRLGEKVPANFRIEGLEPARSRKRSRPHAAPGPGARTPKLRPSQGKAGFGERP